MHLLCVIHALQPGGAERVASILANAWVAEGTTVTLLTLDGGEEPFYRLDARVRWLAAGPAFPSGSAVKAIGGNLTRIFRIRREVSRYKPDVVISFLTETNVDVLIATRGLGLPVIACEHTDPATCPIKPAWGRLRRLMYPWASAVVVLNERARRFFPLNVHGVVIANPVLDPSAVASPAALRGGRRIVAMGRMAPEKCFDRLIKAFAALAPRHPEWSLTILGDGAGRGALEELCRELGVASRVFLPGIVPEPQGTLAQSAIFVSTSVLEGFPMAICEALACGLPVVAAEYHSGVHEIIEQGENGIIVPAGDGRALEDAIEHLIEEPEERVRLGGNARGVTDTFGLSRVLERWSFLLDDVTAAR